MEHINKLLIATIALAFVVLGATASIMSINSINITSNFKDIEVEREETKRTLSQTETRNEFIICVDVVMLRSIEGRQPISGKEAVEFCSQARKDNPNK